MITKKAVAVVLIASLPLVLGACVAGPTIFGYRPTTGETFLGFMLAFFYIWFVFTIAIVTFRKGHTVLGCLGFALPFLWLIGAILPPKHGSQLWVEEGIRQRETIDQMTR